MRSAFGRFLIALGLLMAVGCVLPDRNISRSDPSTYRPSDSTNITASSDLPPNGKISFKAPQKKTVPDQSGNDSVESVRDAADKQNANSKFATTKTGGNVAGLVPGYSSDAIAEAEYDRKSTESPVQLQGPEFDQTQQLKLRPDSRQAAWDDAPTGDPLKNAPGVVQQTPKSDTKIEQWANRPVDRKDDPPFVTQTANSNPPEPYRPTSQSISKQVPSIPIAAIKQPLLPWQAELEQLIARVEQRLADSKSESSLDRQSEHLRMQAHLRLLYLMAQRQEEALTAIPDVEPSQQEYWQQMIWAMSNSLDSTQFPDSSERAAQSVGPLNSALRQIREEAPLSIKNMTFCRKISSFGNYERFPRNEFTPGHEVLLYTEIENFVSTPTLDGEYRTSLKSVIEIADSKGKVVWTKGFPSTEDLCRNPRRDYFHNYQFHIPKDLATGTYTLKLTIADELSHKRISSSLNFVLK